METTPPPLLAPPGEDLRHLELLAIFHYVVAGLLALFACIPLLHVAMGAFFLICPELMEKNPGADDVMATRVFGGIFLLFGSFFVLLGWSLAATLAYAGYCLKRRQHRIFCLVVAGIACTFMPFGTVLGVFTIIMLVKPSVIVLFEVPKSA